MTADDSSAGEFRGASFMSEDFTGATFRDCDLRQVKITDSWLVDVSLSGLVGNLVVNDVDVTAYVDGELDKRTPNGCSSERCVIVSSFDKENLRTMAAVKKYAEAHAGHAPGD